MEPIWLRCRDHEHLLAVRLGLLTHEEIHRLEAELRQARRDVFSEDPEVEVRATAAITAIKGRLAPMWDAHSEECRRVAEAARMRLWE